MISVPRCLYSKEIISNLRYLVEDYDAKYFDDLDDIHKDKLVALGIYALDCDIDIVLGSYANKLLAKHLLSSDRDDEIDLVKALHVSAHEYFSPYYDAMISEIRDEIRVDKMFDSGFRSYKDPQTGEIQWRKSA